MTANLTGRIRSAYFSEFNGTTSLEIELPPENLAVAQTIPTGILVEILVRWLDTSPADKAIEAMPDTKVEGMP